MAVLEILDLVKNVSYILEREETISARKSSQFRIDENVEIAASTHMYVVNPLFALGLDILTTWHSNSV